MDLETLYRAWLLGRNSYITEDLAFQTILDVATQTLRLQIAKVGSQLWEDVMTVAGDGTVTIIGLTPTSSEDIEMIIALGG
jgi:hypothetical protein